jgi:AsmA protein
MKRVLKIAGALVALLLLIVVALPFLIDANRFRPMLESRLSQALGRGVTVGNLKLTLLSGGVTADDLAIADDPAFSRTPFVQAKSFHVGVDLPRLVFSKKLTVTGLTIDQPRIVLLQAPSGAWNFSNMGTGSAGTTATPAPAGNSQLDLSVKLVKITGGRFTLGQTGGHLKPLVLENVNAELDDFAAASAFPFSLSMTVAGGGSIKLDGRAGPIDEADVSMTPATLTLKVEQLDLAGSGLNEVAPSLAGLVSFDGSGQAKGNNIEIQGRLKIDKLKLAPRGTPAKRVLELDFAVAHDLQKRSGAVHRGDIHIGGAVTSLTGEYQQRGDSLAVNMSLAGANMPVEELAEMLPVMGLALPTGASLKGGTAGIKAAIAGPLDKLVTTASLSVNNTRLAGFNLPDRMSKIEKLAGIKGGPDTDIQVLSSNVKVAPEGMSADNIMLVLPAIGELAGGGTVSPDNALNFKMQASVHTSGMAAIVNNEPVPFAVEGTFAEPVFHPDVKMVLKEEVKGMGSGVGKAADSLVKGLFEKKQK